MTRKPMTIVLGKELWQPELVAVLAGLGHTVKSYDDDLTVIISRKAWRVPAGIAQDDLIKHVDTILKQVRALEHEDDPSKDAASVGTGGKPKQATSRKRRTKESGGVSTGATEAAGSTGDPGDAEGPSKPKRRKKVDGADAGC